MAHVIDPASVRAYVTRDWRALRELKRQYWRERLDRGGLSAALEITEELRAESTQKDREEDLETHRRVAETLARVAAARRTGAGRIR